MKTVAFVPIKLNNSRLPHKNTKPFTNGKPLCSYILETLLKVRGVDQVYVYCSNPTIKKILPGGVKYLRRSAELDKDSTSMNEVLLTFSKDVPADVYILSHATAPFVSAASIQKGLDAVLGGEYDSAFAAKTLQDFLWKDGKPFNYSLDNIPRTQDLEPLLKTYISYSFTGLFLSSALNWLWIDVAGLSKMIAPLINLCITVPLNFVLNKFWVF